jgi:hypothetical protein
MAETGDAGTRLFVFELKRFAYSIAVLAQLAAIAALPWSAPGLFSFVRPRWWWGLLATFAAAVAVGLTGLLVMTALCPCCGGAFVTRRTLFPIRCQTCGFDVP